MATLVSDANILIRPSNYPTTIDQQFDLDEVLTLAEISNPYDPRDDRDHQTVSVSETHRSPNFDAGFVADVDSCAVCMESFRSGESGGRIQCGHVYHAGCIAAWLSVCNSCPLCRCTISGDDQVSRDGKHQ